MPDQQVSYLISLGMDKSTAQAAVTGLADLKKGFGEAEKAAHKMAAEARTFKELGATIAVSGAAMLAPFIAAAEQYVSRYKGLEATANAYTLAQKKQADATAELGRVAASALIPIMNQLADVEKQVADFASAHPELVSAAVTGGGALVAAGGTLVAVGQVASTMARIKEIVDGGGLMGNLGKAVIGVAALGAGTAIAIKGLNEFGKATDDQRLATIGLTDILKTGAQIIAMPILLLAKAFVEGKNSAALLVEALMGAQILLNKTFGDIFGDLATTLKKIASVIHDGIVTAINGILEMIAKMADSLPLGAGNAFAASVRAGKLGLDGDSYRTGLDTQNDNDKKARAGEASAAGKLLAASDQQREDSYQADLKNLANFAGGVSGTVNSIGASVSGSVSGIGGSGSGTSPEVTNAYIAFQKQMVEGERIYGQQRLDAQKAFQQDSQRSELAYQESITKTKLDATRKAQEDDTKALIDFNHNESDIQKKNAFERLQQSKAFNQSQLELAAQGDVAGYISAQKSRTFDLGQQDRQNTFDASERQRQFQFEQEQRHREAAQSLKDSLADAAKQHALERQAAKVAFDQQQQQAAIAYKRQQDNQLLNFSTQLAAIQDNNSKLSLVYQAWYLQQQQAATDFVKGHIAIMAKLYSQSLGIGGGGGGGGRGGMPPMIPATNSPGILGSMQSLFGRGAGSGGSSSTVHIQAVNIGTGNHVTADQVRNIVGNAVGRMADAIHGAN